jgi:uncharacterized protein (DUF1778 family)
MAVKDDGVIAFRVTPEHREWIRRAAELEDTSMSDFIRRCAVSKARKLVADRAGRAPRGPHA